MSGRRRDPDYVLYLTVVILLGFGIVMVFSASSIKSFVRYGDSYHFLKRQIIWVVIGLIAMTFTMKVNYQIYRRMAKPILYTTIALLVLVLIPGVGKEINGSQRWLGYGSLTVQPSEIAKLGIIIFMAKYFSDKEEKMQNFMHGLLPPLLVLGVIFGLILKQPDLGTALAIAGSVFIMLFAAGARIGHLAFLASLSLPAVGAMIWLEPYRMRRLTAFLNPQADPQDSGFQILQSLYAIGSGGLVGLGLGRSRQKFFYLPEQHTDFIFAVLGEELGFIGAVTIILLFFLFLWRGYKIAIYSRDTFGSILAVGITSLIGLQAAMNIAIVTSSMPVTGIPLPFISYGGSSLVITLAGVGLLLNISKFSIHQARK